MPTTVTAGFAEFLRRLSPTASEISAAASHRASLEKALQNKLGSTRFFQTGSFSNGTGVRGRSDVDYFASLPLQPQSSSTALNKVRDALKERYPSTSIYVRRPAVVAEFGEDGSETYEVTPAFLKDGAGATRRYEVPSRLTGWKLSAPDAHLAYVRDIDKKFGGDAKKLVRLIKAWKYYRNAPITSFYLEMRTAAYANGESSIVFSQDVLRALRDLRDRKLVAMQDPKGLVGKIYGCATDSDVTDALSKIDTAIRRAEKACGAERRGEMKEAFTQWALVFNGRFPAYG